ncbi:MAG: site-specific integrase [Deltaproteobacteria bacterium]|nr:site-specific integrase [Deltaproteobacteria bacterium]MBW2013629.1 site-specific integrase [Deltaproteobacteria bacterium]
MKSIRPAQLLKVLAACLFSGKTFFKFKQVCWVILHTKVHYILYLLESSAYPQYVFLYDGQIIEAKSGKARKPKENAEAKPVKEIKRSFNSALKRAGIVDFRFHDLRHTFASQLLLKGGTLKDVQEFLGHKIMTMTLRYAHLTQEHKRKAVNLLNGLTAQDKKIACHKTVTIPDQEKSVSM